MEQQRKVLNIGLSIIGGIALICFVLGSFLDQRIATGIGNYYSVFGILFTLLTPVLSLAVGELAGALLFFMPKIEKKAWDIVLRFVGAVAFLTFSVFAIKEGIEYVNFPRMAANETTYKVLAITLVILIDIGIILFVKMGMKHIATERIIPTVIVIFVIVAAWVFVSEVIKHLASRPRPRGIYIEQIYEFRNWFELKPFLCLKDEYSDCKSFVSGHTFIAACLMCSVPMLLSLIKEKAGIKASIIGLAVAGIFSFIVAVSRMVAYAHFMTDVMGAIITSCAAQAVIINVAPLLYKKIKK